MLVYPVDRDDLARLVVFLTECEIPCFVLGGGSNLIVRDGGIRGATLQLGDGFRVLERGDDTVDGPTVRVEAGLPLGRLLRWAVAQGIAGFETLAGIPGPVGGALTMNAGAWGFEIGECVVELETMDPGGRVCLLKHEAVHFSYRALDLPEGHTILGALLKGQTADPRHVQTRVAELQRRRGATQPVSRPSAGSVFKNPPGRSAGRLIEQCGLKGFRVGDAMVSSIHANFIVNTGAATASQVESLMSAIQERVHEKYRVELEPEVRIVGAREGEELQARV
jgi:UDP-N-acetylmuramate dehydrogenase